MLLIPVSILIVDNIPLSGNAKIYRLIGHLLLTDIKMRLPLLREEEEAIKSAILEGIFQEAKIGDKSNTACKKDVIKNKISLSCKISTDFMITLDSDGFKDKYYLFYKPLLNSNYQLISRGGRVRG